MALAKRLNKSNMLIGLYMLIACIAHDDNEPPFYISAPESWVENDPIEDEGAILASAEG